MRRRDLLVMGAAAAGTFAARSSPAQIASPSTRAAVVIGVNKVGGLPILSAAADGARAVADWLGRTQGFEVKLFVDDNTAVKFADVFDAIDVFVDRGTLDQLIVYFSGHGFLNGYTSEVWMLSNAPNNPNEAISLYLSGIQARESAIPNVVFISDACRSTPESLSIGRVQGGIVFPNRGISRNVRSDVDQFLATLPSDPAYEVPLSASVVGFKGIFTDVFLSAFRRPDADMVRSINGIDVVPNNRLRPFLEREVPKMAQAKQITLRQRPDTYVMSGDNTYIGRVEIPASASASPGPPPGTIHDVVGYELKRAGLDILSFNSTVSTPEQLSRLHVETGLAEARSAIQRAQGPNHAETGFTLFMFGNAPFMLAESNPRIKTEVMPAVGAPNVGFVKVQPNGDRPGSVALRFGDGTGTVVAALPGFIGTVAVDRTGVVNVSYAPSPANWRWSDYQQQRERLEQLRVAVAAAARFGVFRIEGGREVRSQRAAALGDAIRILKGIDPTLGLYAAYAYAEADLRDQVASVRNIMREDLNADLFDVALLSGTLSGRRSAEAERLFPFCPMLSQGWGLLRVKNVRLPPEIAEVDQHLRPSLWTTFDSEGMDIIISALRTGRLQ